LGYATPIPADKSSTILLGVYYCAVGKKSTDGNSKTKHPKKRRKDVHRELELVELVDVVGKQDTVRYFLT